MVYLDDILIYWTTRYKIIKNNSKDEYLIIQNNIVLLQKAYSQLPMPGSALIFWRNLFLQFQNNNPATTIKN